MWVSLPFDWFLFNIIKFKDSNLLLKFLKMNKITWCKCETLCMGCWWMLGCEGWDYIDEDEEGEFGHYIYIFIIVTFNDSILSSSIFQNEQETTMLCPILAWEPYLWSENTRLCGGSWWLTVAVVGRAQETTRKLFMRVEGCEFSEDKDNVQDGRAHR